MNGLRLLVGIRFQVSFTPLVGVLFTFPSRYWCTIGRQGVLRLGGWSPRFQTGLHVSRLTRESCGRFRLRGSHPLWPTFPSRSTVFRKTTGLVRVRSPLLTEFRLISFPPATEMFQFAGFAFSAYGFGREYPCGWVAPFGDPGVKACSRLIRAFRSVPRPSSPLGAKASTRCPSFTLTRANCFARLQQDPPRTGENPAHADLPHSLS